MFGFELKDICVKLIVEPLRFCHLLIGLSVVLVKVSIKRIRELLVERVLVLGAIDDVVSFVKLLATTSVQDASSESRSVTRD